MLVVSEASSWIWKQPSLHSENLSPINKTKIRTWFSSGNYWKDPISKQLIWGWGCIVATAHSEGNQGPVWMCAHRNALYMCLRLSAVLADMLLLWKEDPKYLVFFFWNTLLKSFVFQLTVILWRAVKELGKCSLKWLFVGQMCSKNKVLIGE